ncbi:hypothetical protein [Lysinibacillus xylanilyticus]|uniref:hypothetical protein n=1 Tax=Lysinibacillus xylanilyticus TaxID=582475 RepID=UPI00380C7AE3
MRDINLQIVNEFHHLESESEVATLNFLTGGKQTMTTKTEKVFAKLELDIEVGNLSTEEFVKQFYDFVSQLQSKDAAMDFKTLDARLIETQTVDKNGTEEFVNYEDEIVGMVI